MSKPSSRPVGPHHPDACQQVLPPFMTNGVVKSWMQPQIPQPKGEQALTAVYEIKMVFGPSVQGAVFVPAQADWVVLFTTPPAHP